MMMVMMMMTLMKLVNSGTNFRPGIAKFYQPNLGCAQFQDRGRGYIYRYPFIYLHMCVYTQTHTHIYIYIYIENNVCTYMHMHSIYTHIYNLYIYIYIMHAYTQCMYTCIYIYSLFIHIHRHIHLTQKSHPRFSYQCDPMTRSRMISTSPRCTNSDPVGPLQGLATLAMWRPSVMPPCAKVSRRLGWLGRDLQLCYFGYPAFFWGRKWMKIHRRWSLTSGNMELWGFCRPCWIRPDGVLGILG